jgi:hypothetical protein
VCDGRILSLRDREMTKHINTIDLLANE